MAVGGSVEFARATSRTRAEELIAAGGAYDMIVCDLRIPAQDDGLDRAPQHGLSVQATAGRLLPGTPVILLTGVAEANIDEIVAATSAGGLADVLGDGGRAVPLVQMFRKDRILECAQAVLDFASRLARLDEVQLEGEAALLAGLDPSERRAICLAARQWRGSRATVRRQGGGLSGGRTLHVVVSDEQYDRASIFLKIDLSGRCREEQARYSECILGKLSHESFPPLTHALYSFLGSRGCLVYKFADNWTGSLFSSLAGGVDERLLVTQVRELMAHWESMKVARRSTLGQVRETGIGMGDLETAIRAGSDRAEELLAMVGTSEQEIAGLVSYPQHGDLHGENVLVSSSGRPTLIDCGDVGSHLAGLDPVTLELSLALHPDSPLRAGDWPTEEQAGSWMDVDAFSANCPYAEFVRSCRAWSVDAAGDGLKAVAYQYVTRQLKYADTPKPVLLAILRALLDTQVQER